MRSFLTKRRTRTVSRIRTVTRIQPQTRIRARILSFVPILILALGCNSSQESRIIRLAHGLDTSHSVHKAMVHMGQEIQRLSKGTLTLEIYPNQQLGGEREILELLQIGTLDMTKVSAATLENFAPKIGILGLPYLFRNRRHAFAVLDGPIGRELLDDGKQNWLKGLGFYDAGYRSFYSMERPIRHPDDLQGLKVRVMESATAMDMVRNLGGSPTPISWGELYTSLQQGVVDAAENNPPSFYLARHYEVCRYYTLDEHTFSPDVLIAGTRFWNSLDDRQAAWLEEAARSSVAYQRELWARAEAEALRAVAAAGVEIIHPEKDPFARQASDTYTRYEKDPEFRRIIRQIQQTERP